MKLIFTFLLTAVIAFATAQEKYKKEIVGKLERKIFTEDEELKKWFVKGYEAYKPDTRIVQLLSQKLSGKKIIVILGTWCSDSQREIPRLFKILHDAVSNSIPVKLIGISRNKKRPPLVVHKYHITHVPTIIIYDSSDKELGRIIETSAPTLEENMLLILK